MKIVHLLSATALAGTLAVAAPVLAQTQESQRGTERDTPATATSPTSPQASVDTSPDASDETGEVTVTGSRIRQTRTINNAVPVATLSAGELLGARGDVSLGDAINQLPQLRSTFSQANSTAFIGTAGINLADLRGLGTDRTLTLVNGRRIVSASPGSYAPDINTLPFDLIERVDVVTGGNSAIYGSDAIAGVLNFVTRRSFDGIRLRAQAGATSYNDRGTVLVSGIAGHSYLDGRLNVMTSGEYSTTKPVYFAERPYLHAFSGRPAFITSQITTAPNRNFDGVPNTLFVSRGSVFGNRSTGGTIIGACPTPATPANAAQRAANCTGYTGPTGVPLAWNYVFRPDGSIVRDSPTTTGLVDNRQIGGGVLFGETATGVEDAMLLPGLERIVANLMIRGDFSPAFRPFMEGTVVQVRAEQQSTQPTFNTSSLNANYSINNPFLTPAARATLTTILAPGATTFVSQRFNNDFGTRSEFHTRRTYRAVLGAEGDISQTGNLRYEVAGSYGRTENFYRTGGNVLVANYNRAINAVLAPASFTGSNFLLNAQGQRVICAANVASNAFPDCLPLNTFGRGAFDRRALDNVLYSSTRTQFAQQINATAFLSGDSTGLFELPGGPVGFVLGGEYRRESAGSSQDPITASGQTFLNPAAIFNPPAVNIKEVFGELRVPLLANMFAAHELTAEGAVRVSDYGGSVGSVTAWNAGGIWAPVRDVRFRATYARSVRAPNLGNLFASRAQTFAGISDPCNQPTALGVDQSNNISTNPNRRRNCAAAGIPTTISLVAPNGDIISNAPWSNISTSTIPGVNQGNLNLTPEIGNSFTAGVIIAPQFVPGLVFKVDYYNIRVNNVISGLSGQAILNRCYDDPTGINNIFCDAIFRRSTGNPATNFTFLGQTNRTVEGRVLDTFPQAGDGVSFINQPYNFAQLRNRGIDFEASYTKKFSEEVSLNFKTIASYVLNRQSFSYIAEPGRFDRVDSLLGDPKWQGQFVAGGKFGDFDVNYNALYIGKQIVSGLDYETFFRNQGRGPNNPDARPFVFYDPIIYHNVRIGLNATDKFRLYFGVDNIGNVRPPFELTGTGADAIYPNIGRYLYSGVEARF